MVTLRRYKDSDGTRTMEFVGLTTDTKPITKFENITIINGSTLFLMDSGEVYMYDQENAIWHSL